MAPKRANIIPPVPPLGEDEARRAWATQYRQYFTKSWGSQGGFPAKTVAVRWAVSNQDLYAQQPLSHWGAALREFINLELTIDNAKPSNLLGPSGSWVKEYRKQMEEEGPKVSGVRIGEAEYKEAMGEWIEAIDSVAALKLNTQAAVDLERALNVNQEQMQTDQLMMRMNDKARRAEQAEVAYAAVVQAHMDSQAEVLQTEESEDESVLDPVEEEGIRNLQATAPSVTSSSSSAVSKRARATSSLLTSRSSSAKRGKTIAKEDEAMAQSASVLADAMKDGMKMLVRGLSGADEAADRLDRVEKAQREIKDAQEAAESVAKDRHEELLALIRGQSSS